MKRNANHIEPCNQAALRSLSGLQNPEPVVDEVRLYFTQATWCSYWKVCKTRWSTQNTHLSTMCINIFTTTAEQLPDFEVAMHAWSRCVQVIIKSKDGRERTQPRAEHSRTAVRLRYFKKKVARCTVHRFMLFADLFHLLDLGFTHRVVLGVTGPVLLASLFAVNSKVKALRNTDGGKWLAQHVVADTWTSTWTARIRS